MNSKLILSNYSLLKSKRLTILTLFLLLYGFNLITFAQVAPQVDNTKPSGITTNSPLRAGETLVLVGQGGTSYEWTGPNNFYSTLNNVEIPNITLNETGTYYLSVFNSYDSTTTNFSTNVLLKPYNGQCLNVENSTVCLNSYLNMSSSWGAPYTNTWSSTFPIGISIPNVQNPGSILMDPDPPISLPAGTYSVTLTVTLNGITYCEETIDIDVENCCLPGPMAVNVLDNETTSSNPYPFTSTTVIRGSLVVDNIFTLPSNVNELIILPGSSVIIKDTKSFTAENTHIHGCEHLWNSFMLIDKSSIILTRCHVLDAYYAILNSSTNNTMTPLIVLQSCDFLDNFNAIQLNGCTPQLDLNTNHFYGVNGLLGSQPSPPLDPAHVGIFLHHCLGTTIMGSGLNEFYNLNVGIWAWASDLTIGSDATYFHNISTIPNYSRVALHANTETYSSATYTLRKYGNSSVLDFQDCTQAIAMVNNAGQIRLNHMKNVDNGIFSIDCKHKVMEISNNAINCSYVGIGIGQFSAPIYSLTVSDNTIDLQATNNIPTTAGILVNQSNYPPDDFARINNNYIQVDQGQYGMVLNSTQRYEVTTNYVKLNDCQTNLAGIQLTNGRANFLQCNTVLGIDPNCSNSTYSPSGLRFISSTDGYYGFNNTDKTYVGVTYEDNCSNTNFNNHIFYNHYLGLYYNPNALVGQQFHHGNHWVGSYTWSANNTGFTSGNEYFIGINGSFPPIPYSPSLGWFNPTYQYEAVSTTPCGGGPIGNSPIVINPLEISATDTAVALDQISFTAFEQEQKWGTQKGLYNKLSDDSTALTSNTMMQQFYDSIQFASSGQYQELNGNLLNAQELSASDIIDIDSINILIGLVKDSIVSLDHVAALDTLSNINAQALVQRSLYISQLEGLKLNLGNIIQSYNSSFAQQIPLINTENSQLPDTIIIEANQKLYNSIFLSTFAIGAPLNESQKIQLLSIAGQCPISGGAAVYLSRCLVASFIDTTFNDTDICWAVGIVKSTKTNIDAKTNTFTYYPNPTSGTLTLEWSNCSDDRASMEIVNMSGLTIYKNNFSLKDTSCKIDVTFLPPGSYNMRVLVNNDIIRVGQFILVK